jgi:hypothetical protein
MFGEKPKHKESAQRKESSTQLRHIPHDSAQKEESVWEEDITKIEE